MLLHYMVMGDDARQVETPRGAYRTRTAFGPGAYCLQTHSWLSSLPYRVYSLLLLLLLTSMYQCVPARSTIEGCNFDKEEYRRSVRKVSNRRANSGCTAHHVDAAVERS